MWGVLITVLDVFVLLALQKLGMRKLEAVIITLVVLIGLCFIIEMFFIFVITKRSSFIFFICIFVIFIFRMFISFFMRSNMLNIFGYYRFFIIDNFEYQNSLIASRSISFLIMNKSSLNQ